MMIFPTLTGMSFTVNKGPSWSTLTKQAASGRQVRVSLQSSPIWKFKLAFEYLRDRAAATSDVQNLWAFFNSVGGQFKPFYFLDPYDNAVLDQGVGVGNGSTTSFQLTRTVGAATAYPWIEPVYGVSGAPTVYVNGTATEATLNAYGVISFSTPPAAGAAISWSGTFMFLCHFTQDDVQPSQMVKGLWSLDGLEFESLPPMKAATTTLINFLENATTYVRADLYTFTLNSGAVLRYTSANAPVTTTITVNGVVRGPYTWNVGPPISDEGVQSSRGVNAASVDITLNGGTGVWTVNGEDILDFIDGFGFDGALIRIDRAWAPDWPTMFGGGPTGTHCRFSGLFTEAKELGETQAVITVQDPRSVLQTRYPAEVYSTSCLNVFGDANCSVDVAALTVTGSVIASGGNQLTFDTTLTHDGNYFALGVITFTSGDNTGLSRSVKTYSQGGGGIYLTAPLPAVPQPGDSFTISPGCSLALSSSTPQGCQQWQPATWQNRFRGQPFVPAPTTGLPT